MIRVKCHRCEHVWTYKGSKKYANCPFCRTMVKVRDITFEEFWELNSVKKEESDE